MNLGVSFTLDDPDEKREVLEVGIIQASSKGGELLTTSYATPRLSSLASLS